MRTLLFTIVVFPWTCVEALCQNNDPEVVITAAITVSEVAAGQSFIGAVTASRKSIIGSAVDGRVVELHVDDGDAIGPVGGADAAGIPIAQLRTKTISIEIAASRAALQLREQELRELESGSRPEEVRRAAAELAAANALMKYSQARYERMKQLFEDTNTATREEFEEAQSTWLAAEQKHLAERAAFELIEQGPRKEQIEQARARAKMAEEDLNRLEDLKNKYTVRAPFEGFVVAMHTEIGAWVSRGDPVAEIVQLDPIEVRVSVPEAYIAHVGLGDDVRIRLDSAPEQLILGNVTRIVPEADLRSRTFPVVIRLPNPKQDGSHLLKSGMLASVTMGVGPRQKALMVPKDALVLNGAITNIVLVEPGPPATVRVVPVQLGVAEESHIQVTDPTRSLRPGQQVVIRGNERLRPGQAVRVVQSRTQ